jgi:hypothetical protein
VDGDLPRNPEQLNRRLRVREISVHATRRTCASLLVALDVHPRVAMQILRHSQIAVTMNVYSEAPSKATRTALKRLGKRNRPTRLYFAVLAPGETVQELVRLPVPAPWPHRDSDPTYRAVVDMTFTDAAGREWHRRDMHQPERRYSAVQRLEFRWLRVIASWYRLRALRRSTRDSPPGA